MANGYEYEPQPAPLLSPGMKLALMGLAGLGGYHGWTTIRRALLTKQLAKAGLRELPIRKRLNIAQEILAKKSPGYRRFGLKLMGM